jgi:PIN domain nuclease of toxin-antitoxin system
VRLLLDTHVLIWWLMAEPRLKKSAIEHMNNINNIVYVSALSIWEISIKTALGKIRMPTGNLEAEIENNGFSELPISISHALAAGALPMHHRDPFDRMLVAQARTEGLTIISHDKFLEAYDVPILWT